VRRARVETPASKQKFDTELLVSDVLLKLHTAAVVGLLDDEAKADLTTRLLKANSSGTWADVLTESVRHAAARPAQAPDAAGLVTWLSGSKRRPDRAELDDVTQPVVRLLAATAPGSAPTSNSVVALLRLFVAVRNATVHGAFGHNFYRRTVGTLTRANDWVIERSPLWKWTLVLPQVVQGRTVGRVMRGDNPVDAVTIEADAGDAWAMVLREGSESLILPHVVYINPADNETYIANGHWLSPSAEFLGHAIEADEDRTGKLQRRIPRGSPEPLAGDLVEDRYRIQRELGRGSVAVAYLATDTWTRAEYVLKRWTHPERDMSQAETEMRVLRDLTHPNIPRAWDARRIGGPFHLRLEYVPGRPLHEIAGQDPDQRVDVMEVASTILDVLAYVHERGYLHRDVSPGNILVSEQPERRVWLIDFDLAARPGVVEPGVGDARYRAPEVDDGEPWTAACDLYSLAAVLVEYATSRLPAEVARDPGPAMPASVDGAVTPDVLEVLMAAASPEPGRRPQSARVFARLLREAAGIEPGG
jgi:predicted Ser/Thr protein kinase